MKLTIQKTETIAQKQHLIVLGQKGSDFSPYQLNEQEQEYLQRAIANKQTEISINQYSRWLYVILLDRDQDGHLLKEAARKLAYSTYAKIKEAQIDQVQITDVENSHDVVLAFTEGLVLSNYQFLKYFKEETVNEKQSSLASINVCAEGLPVDKLTELSNILKGVYLARDLVNRPVIDLSAEDLAESIHQLGQEAGFSVEVFDKAKIEALKMGGLLAVNSGSFDPPTFSVMEWKPENPQNERPIILVGKGVVYDTGGVSLKPTSNSMDYMKSDMGGAAATIGTIYAVAKNHLPLHVIGLVPATDNRPGNRAYTPGDVIKMHNGLTVEVMNTDAEGRMILADALSYAQRYKPELVIDTATLTGSAARAIGKEAVVSMGTAENETFERLLNSGKETCERVVRFPLWKEYGEYLKSTIADTKNIGGAEAGSITAGKFLELFTDYPWIHIDIAGSAFSHSTYNYRGIGGTGVGVRLLYHLLNNYSK